MNTDLCKLLGIKYPIFQGAMAWIAENNLAAAVSDAGGLGIIAGGNAPADAIREEIRKLRKKTDKPFAVNIMLQSPFKDDIVQLCVDEKVPAVTTGAGSPAPYMTAFKNAGIKVMPVVPSVALAKSMEKLGADAIIAEGMESGGHIGKLTTIVLVPQVADAVNIPVVAAGGIADGRGMLASFVLGAAGVQIGTRFLVAKECIVHQNYKDKILKANDISTTITGQLTGHPVRGIKNDLSRQFEKAEKEEGGKEKPDIARIETLGVGALRRAVVEGDMKTGSVLSGQIAGMVDKEQTCAEIINEMMSEFAALDKTNFFNPEWSE